jgi:SAM-dependent MidA family methyltransferase
MSSVPAPIAAAIRDEGGRVTFARFMELALTHPLAGYYTTRSRILGPSGDFSTAPRMAPAFNRMMAGLLEGLVDAVEGTPVLLAELGPGEGDMTSAILRLWDEVRPDLRERVVVRAVDVPGGLLASQEHSLAHARATGWDVGWEPGPPSIGGPGLEESPAAALVYSNELFDALPVHRVDVGSDRARECWVRLDEEGLVEEWRDLSPECVQELQVLFDSTDAGALRGYTRDGRVEVRPAVAGLLADWAYAFPEVCFLTVDYGEWRTGPPGKGAAAQGQRTGPVESATGSSAGPESLPHEETVRAYARHRRQADLYRYPGRQDLTADVDFRALAIHGGRCGLECLGFTVLAAALSGLGGRDEAERLRHEAAGSLEADVALTALSALLDPQDVGGLFKVMLQVGG